MFVAQISDRISVALTWRRPFDPHINVRYWLGGQHDTRAISAGVEKARESKERRTQDIEGYRQRLALQDHLRRSGDDLEVRRNDARLRAVGEEAVGID